MDHKSLTKETRFLLDRLIRARSLPNDLREEIYDEVLESVRALPGEGIVAAVEKAVGRNKARRLESIYLLCERLDQPEAQDRVSEWLFSSDSEWRSVVIQEIEHRGLSQFGPLLVELIESESDEFCLELAIHAVGRLQVREALPVLLELGAKGVCVWKVAWALKDLAAPEGRPLLERWYSEAEDGDSLRVIAAWGLAKLGHLTAFEFLVVSLDDAGSRTETSYQPGNSIRAAQAVCDIKGWPFEWGASAVVATKELLGRTESSG